MRLSHFFLFSKKNLRLKCSQCFRLLPAAHFNALSAPAHTLTCMKCRPLCVVCGICKSLDQFTSSATLSSSSPSATPSELGFPAEQSRPPSAVKNAPPELRMCDGCLLKEHVARTNVFYRYPILKYRSCPFPVEEYRDALLNSTSETK